MLPSLQAGHFFFIFEPRIPEVWMVACRHQTTNIRRRRRGNQHANTTKPVFTRIPIRFLRCHFFPLPLFLIFRPWAIRPRNNFWAVHTWWVKCWGMKCFFFSCVKFYAIETNWFWNYECRVAYFAGKKWLAFLSWCKIIQALCQERDDSC